MEPAEVILVSSNTIGLLVLAVAVLWAIVIIGYKWEDYRARKEAEENQED